LTSDEAETLLVELAFEAKLAGVDVVTHARTKDAAGSIIEVAEEVAADLIVVGNKAMHGARRVLGSIPNSVSHQARCSVLIVQTT
jgi:nucleotide-binding universal stress UspA family protein